MMPLLRHAALAAVLVLAACGGRGDETAQPDDATVSHRIVEHFRRTVTTPGLTFRVLRLGDAEIPGWRKGALQVALGDQAVRVHHRPRRDASAHAAPGVGESVDAGDGGRARLRHPDDADGAAAGTGVHAAVIRAERARAADRAEGAVTPTSAPAACRSAA